MAKVKFNKRTKKYDVVHSITGVPTSQRGFSSKSAASSAARALRCRIMNKGKKRKRSCPRMPKKRLR